jgi:iron complex outermembrane receptor protein
MLGVAAGVQADNWTAEVYVDNVTDERAQLSGTFQMKRSRIAISRPLTIGLRVSMEI